MKKYSFYNYQISKKIVESSKLIQDLNETACDLILVYMDIDSDLFQEIGYYDLEQKKIAIVDIYLKYYCINENIQLNDSSLNYLNDFVEYIEETIDDVLDEI